MKTTTTIEKKIQSYKKEIKELDAEIANCLSYQKEHELRVTLDCDYVQERKDKIGLINAKISMLIWVLE